MHITNKKNLDILDFPLNQKTLVEASAGSGKTFTIVELYLRLLLQVGDNCAPRALTVEEILVVTFTKMATAELKERIRQRIVGFKNILAIQLNKSTTTQSITDQDQKLLDQINDIQLAWLRLQLAEQNIDLVAIYTIDGFCQQVLSRYAFDAGTSFSFNLITDLNRIHLKLLQQFWRTNFYPLDERASAFIDAYLVSPENIYAEIVGLLVKKNPIELIVASAVDKTDTLATCLKQITLFIELLDKVKNRWLQLSPQLANAIAQACENKLLSKRSFRADWVTNRINKINQWAETKYDYSLIKELEYFTTDKLAPALDDARSDNIFTDELFINISALLQQPIKTIRNQLLWHAYIWLKQATSGYLDENNQHSFDSLLTTLANALTTKHASRLLKSIRQQFPYAMIDEFQDTDPVQYNIFQQIYLKATSPTEICGFTMIGDPKQSIYAFRGADIFAYIQASKQVNSIYTLPTNWRSNTAIINTTNKIFSSELAFLYQEIDYQTQQVAPNNQVTGIYQQQQLQTGYNFYLTNVTKAEKKQTNAGFKNEMAKICAKQIANSLNLVQRQELMIKTKDQQYALQAKDIAILVRSKNDAYLMEQALQDVGVASIFLSTNQNIFASQEALEVQSILLACLDYRNIQAIYNACATSIFLQNMQTLEQLKEETVLNQWILRFTEYAEIWQQRGILAMLQHVLLSQQLPAKLLTQRRGERQLTNILHLAELLQQQMNQQNGQLHLLHWLEQQILDAATNNASQIPEHQQLRLESERELVKIITIHKAKGLEYAMVWLPFVLPPNVQEPNTNLMLAHDEQGINLQLNLTDDGLKDSFIRENMAEDIRLLYVALTRAKYQVHLGIGDVTKFELDNNQLSYMQPLLYLLLQLYKQQDNQDAITNIEQLLNATLNTEDTASYINIDYASNWQENISLDPLIVEDRAIDPVKFQQKIENNWKITSFTELANFNHMITDQVVQNNNDLPINHKVTDELFEVQHQNLTIATQEYNQFNLVKGAEIGVALHSILEQHNFTQAVVSAQIEPVLSKLNLADEWLEPILNWFNHSILTTPFAQNGLSLQQVTNANRLVEMEFLIAINENLDTSKFNQLLMQYEPLASTALQLPQIQGMLHGFIDLLVQHQQQYYIIDYKSNYLGDDFSSYQATALDTEIQKHNYHLQYILYTVAMHRYLKTRLANYDYQRDIAGVYYLFLRGMNGVDADTGVFHCKPDFNLIDGLDKLFAGG